MASGGWLAGLLLDRRLELEYCLDPGNSINIICRCRNARAENAKTVGFGREGDSQTVNEMSEWTLMNH